MIHIITDSTCEAPLETLQHSAVTVVPLTVVFGEEALRDGVEITREQFWSRLPSSNPLPSTSQANPSDFSGLFDEYSRDGHEVIALLLSEKLSGTMSSALTAQQAFPDRPISVVNSKSISIGLGFLLQEAVRMVDAGETREQIVARLTEMREKIHIVFVLDTIEYLARGGRIGKAQAFAAGLLKLLPLLGIVDGEVAPLARVRTRTKALVQAQEMLLRQITARGPEVKLALTHACAGGEAEDLGKKLSKDFLTMGYFVAELGPVIGVHVGPGTVGIGVYADD
jgi:DegV family protein with EDD domain